MATLFSQVCLGPHRWQGPATPWRGAVEGAIFTPFISSISAISVCSWQRWMSCWVISFLLWRDLSNYQWSIHKRSQGKRPFIRSTNTWETKHKKQKPHFEKNKTFFLFTAKVMFLNVCGNVCFKSLISIGINELVSLSGQASSHYRVRGDE